MPVLVSEGQGLGKSKFVGWLFPEHGRAEWSGSGIRLNQLGTTSERDMMAGLLPRVIIEIPDLAGIRKTDLQTLNHPPPHCEYVGRVPAGVPDWCRRRRRDSSPH